MSILENYTDKAPQGEEVSKSAVPYLMYPHNRTGAWSQIKAEIPELKEYDPVLAHRKDSEGRMGCRLLKELKYVFLRGERFWSDNTEDNSIVNPTRVEDWKRTEWRIQAGILVEGDVFTPFTIQVKKQWCQGFRPAAEGVGIVSTDEWYGKSPEHKLTKDMPPNFRFLTIVSNIDRVRKAGPTKGKTYKANEGRIVPMPKDLYVKLGKWATANEAALEELDDAYSRKVQFAGVK